jgi:ParB-like chromosome segregation protein Spo0J
MKMKKLTISYRPLSEVAVNPRNARTHDTRQLKQIKDSIAAFGFTNPLLVIILEHLSETQKRALMLADNKIALNASWDMDLLANELADLSSMDLEFNLELTGFEVADIDFIIGEVGTVRAKLVETGRASN